MKADSDSMNIAEFYGIYFAWNIIFLDDLGVWCCCYVYMAARYLILGHRGGRQGQKSILPFFYAFVIPLRIALIFRLLFFDLVSSLAAAGNVGDGCIRPSMCIPVCLLHDTRHDYK